MLRVEMHSVVMLRLPEQGHTLMPSPNRAPCRAYVLWGVADDHSPAGRHDADSPGNYSLRFCRADHGAGAFRRRRQQETAGLDGSAGSSRRGRRHGPAYSLPLAGNGPRLRRICCRRRIHILFHLSVPARGRSGHSGLHGLSGARPRPTRRVLRPGPDGNRGHVLYGGLHGPHHDFPGAGNFLHLDLHPGRLPAGRPPLQRSLAEVFLCWDRSPPHFSCMELPSCMA
jgi:hypothetical protein